MSDVERLLADYPFPPTPDVAGPAARRLPARPRRRVPRTVVVLAALAVVGGLVAVPPTRGALLDLLDRVPGVSLERVDDLPEVGLQRTPFGTPATLQRARDVVALRLPDGVGPPTALYVDLDHDAVTAVYGSGETARLVVTQFPAERVLFEKMLGYETQVEGIAVDGAPGLWIEGAPHDVFYDDERRVGGYLAGNVLIWHTDGVTYRIEADVSRERALELARSLRPA